MLHTPWRVPFPLFPKVEKELKHMLNIGIIEEVTTPTDWFWQIPLDPSSQKLTTFITPMGRICFKRLPFRITSAPEIFQQLMSNLLQGLEGTVVVMDDILVFGANKEEHDRRLDVVL